MKYTIYFKSFSEGRSSIDVNLADPKLKVDYLAYLNGAPVIGRAYARADGTGEVILDFREICAIEAQPE